MAKVFVKNIDQDPHLKLYRDPKTGLAWIEDGHAGVAHSCHPNISASGSAAGMKRKGWWGKKDRTVRSHGFIHNIDLLVMSTDLDQVACDYCNCGGKHRGRPDHGGWEYEPRTAKPDPDAWSKAVERSTRAGVLRRGGKKRHAQPGVGKQVAELSKLLK